MAFFRDLEGKIIESMEDCWIRASPTKYTPLEN
jgi:hypothetical protein